MLLDPVLLSHKVELPLSRINLLLKSINLKYSLTFIAFSQWLFVSDYFWNAIQICCGNCSGELLCHIL